MILSGILMGSHNIFILKQFWFYNNTIIPFTSYKFYTTNVQFKYRYLYRKINRGKFLHRRQCEEKFPKGWQSYLNGRYNIYLLPCFRISMFFSHQVGITCGQVFLTYPQISGHSSQISQIIGTRMPDVGTYLQLLQSKLSIQKTPT